MPATRRIALPVLGRAPDADAAAVPQSASGSRVHLVTLGCDKNTVDSERLMAALAGAGARLGEAAADVVVINTCGFIDMAKEESIEAILDAVRLKREGRIRAVVAMGCLVQRYRTELEAEIPEVDAFLGLTEASQLVPVLRARGLLEPAGSTPLMEQPLRMLTHARAHSSFLKISEGCDHTCAFCAIPLMRGKHRSTPMHVLVQEAQELAAAGIREVNIVSQDTTWYGRDTARGVEVGGGDYFVGRTFDGMANASAAAPAALSDRRVRGDESRGGLLPDLLRTLVRETDVPWYRLFYMYPSGIRPELVELMASEPRILPYLDMPIQHGSDAVLRRMRRPERRATILERVRWLRDALPDVTLRTTVIVGFPGETERDFEVLIELLEEVRFDRVGAFAYSTEEGTLAAGMTDMVEASVRRERLERLLDVQRGIEQERNERWIGRTVDVLVERSVGRDSDMDDAGDVRGAVGRTAGQAPEIDGVLHIALAEGIRPGDFVKVEVTDAIEQDLTGTLVEGDA
jgi:ribosomal protein S12 methylthiotransferase